MNTSVKLHIKQYWNGNYNNNGIRYQIEYPYDVEDSDKVRFFGFNDEKTLNVHINLHQLFISEVVLDKEVNK